MAKVTIEHVTKRFRGDVVAVDDVSLSVADGEFVVLVGPSGCGKSTLLRMIAGLEEPTAGTIRIGERDVTRVAPKDRDVAMVFQNYALYPHMTVERNMGFGLKLRGTPRGEIQDRVAAAAELLGLAELLGRRPGELSGGQRQRVAVGRAIVRDPAVFLFDEPLSNLDALLRIEMRREFAALHRRLGATMIHVTHDQVEAMTLGDRIVVMHAGVVQQVGPPLEVYDRPANTFVAGFLGSPPMNLVPPEVLGVDVTSTPGNPQQPGCSLRGIRPEHLRIEPGPEALDATVTNVQPLGNETLIEVAVAGSSLLVRGASHGTPAVGAAVAVAFDPARVHRFDAMGVRIDEPTTTETRSPREN